MTNADSKAPVTVQWLGQMGLLIRAGGKVICVDYFASPDPQRAVPPPVARETLTGVDVFAGTHDHMDHIDHESWKIWAANNPSAKFVFPRAHKAAVLADGVAEENAVGLNDGESVDLGGVTIHAVAAAHEFLEMDESTGLYPHLQYIIEAGGARIYHAGDTVRYEGMLGRITSRGPIDLMLVPINGRDAVRLRQDLIGNMTYQEAADLAGDICPKLVIPGHWDMFAFNSEDPAKFKDYIEVKYGGKFGCVVPAILEETSV